MQILIIVSIVTAIAAAAVSTLGGGLGGVLGSGHGASAPEIGAGLMGMALAVGAVKYFRRRQRG